MMDLAKEQELRAKIKGLVKEYYELYHQPKEYEVGERISYAGRVYDEKEMLALTDATLDFWLTNGRFTAEFEKGLAQYLGLRHANMVNSGSSANLLAFMTLTAPELGERQIRRGDEVITVACSFPTTIAPIIQYGAVPVFVDVSLPTYNIDVRYLEEALSPKTKAVILAHTLGNPFDLAAVKAFCDKHGLWLVEDNCDALGSLYNGKLTGTFGDLGTSSFYPAHHITTGEGGAVYTDNPLLHKLMLSYRDWGRDCVCSSGEDNHCGRRFSREYEALPTGYDHKYVYSHFGYNLKATDLQASIGVEQLKKIDGFTKARQENWAKLRAGVSDLEDRLILPEKTPNSEPSFFGFILTLRDDRRAKVIERLEAANIQTRLLFSGNITKHPCFNEVKAGGGYRIASTLAVTDEILSRTFWVGVYPGMSDSKIEYMIEKIRLAVR